VGLVTRVVPPGELEAEGKRWADRLLALDAAAVAACKTFFRDTAFMHTDEAADLGVGFLADFNMSR